MGSQVSPERERLIREDPFCARLGIALDEIEPGFARTTLELTEDHLNFHGLPHGGAIYALADGAFAAASNAAGEDAFALETNVSYLDRVSVGDVLVATARNTHETRRTAEYEVVVSGPNEDRVATFRGRVYKP